MSQLSLITIKIEKYRTQLANLINKKDALTDKEIVKVSQELDKHIYSYYELVG